MLVNKWHKHWGKAEIIAYPIIERRKMEKPTWLIEKDFLVTKDVFPTIPQYIINSGNKYVEFENLGYNKYKALSHIEDNYCIAYGTIQFINFLKNTYVPGEFDFKQPMTSSFYMTKFPMSMFFNNDAYFLPLKLVEDRMNSNEIDYDIFLRPDAGNKVFSGLPIFKNDSAIEFKTLRDVLKVDESTICQVSKAKSIHSEYRYVIVDKDVVAGSQYHRNNRLDIRIDCHVNANILARQIANMDYQLDRAYVVDIFLDENENAFIGEFNSVCTAGMYACDVENVVNKLNNLAYKMWKEYTEV